MAQDAQLLVDNSRQIRGKTLAKHARIKKVSEHLWVVPSASHKGTYVVDSVAASCTCPDHEETRTRCKHLWALAYARHEVTETDDKLVSQETLAVTYRQNWPAYNRAQTTEKDHVARLLRDLCRAHAPPPVAKRGRPALPLADVLYSAVMKTYVGLSGRRATSDLRACVSQGHLEKAPSYNAIFAYLERPEMTPLLTTLIERAADPLKSVETHFSADSTGFGTATYYRWFDQKYGQERSERRFVNCHVMTGAKTNVVTAVRVYAKAQGDAPELPGLLASTAERFAIKEVSADKAYLSHANVAAIEAVGAVPFIPFKVNSAAGTGSDAWSRMWAMFTLQQNDFAQHYHLRSNVESTFHMVKSKFGAAVRAKTDTAQVNEVLCKILCHNLSVLVHAFHELGLELPFGYDEAPSLRVRVAL